MYSIIFRYHRMICSFSICIGTFEKCHLRCLRFQTLFISKTWRSSPLPWSKSAFQFSRRFTLVKGRLLQWLLFFFFFFFVRRFTSPRIDPLFVRLSDIFIYCNFQLKLYDALYDANVLYVRRVHKFQRVPPTKIFGIVRQKIFLQYWRVPTKFFETKIFRKKKIVIPPSLAYLSKTQFFFSILKGPPTKCFGTVRRKIFFRRSWYLLTAIAWDKHTRKYEFFWFSETKIFWQKSLYPLFSI